MPDELKSCPFCGCFYVEMKSGYNPGDKPFFWLSCVECGACGPVVDTPSGSVRAWSRRVTGNATNDEVTDA